MSKYKIGDDIYCEFKPGKVARLNSYGGVAEVDYGYGSLSGADLNNTVRRATPEVKTVSARFEALQGRIRAAEGRMSINWPDIHRHLVQLWKDVCDRNSEGDKSLYDAAVEAAEYFVNSLITDMKKLREHRVQGIKLFRP